MLSVEEARGRILEAFNALPSEPVSILDSLGRTLAEDIVAGFNIPPLANSSMDGYAVRASDVSGATESSPRRLRVISSVAAGYVSDRAVEPDTAIRIMTGAPIPDGADVVVQKELTALDGEDVLVQAGLPAGTSIRPSGQDVQAGQVVLSRGKTVRSAEVGVLASLGMQTAFCVRRPRVAILATGDELLEPGEPPQPGKIYNANAYALAAQVRSAGAEPVMLGIARDTRESLSEKIEQVLAHRVDLLLSSGGVSVGDFDLVKDMLTAQGTIDFWQVNMKPGKPLAFGHISGVPMIGLPGNPVSSMVSFELFGRSAIRKMLGVTAQDEETLCARMLESYDKEDGRRHYLRVWLSPGEGGYVARLTGEQGSGVLTSMSRANALAVIPESQMHTQQGSEVDVMPLV